MLAPGAQMWTRQWAEWPPVPGRGWTLLTGHPAGPQQPSCCPLKGMRVSDAWKQPLGAVLGHPGWSGRHSAAQRPCQGHLLGSLPALPGGTQMGGPHKSRDVRCGLPEARGETWVWRMSSFCLQPVLCWRFCGPRTPGAAGRQRHWRGNRLGEGGQVSPAPSPTAWTHVADAHPATVPVPLASGHVQGIYRQSRITVPLPVGGQPALRPGSAAGFPLLLPSTSA